MDIYEAMDILEISPSQDKEEIKKKYRKLVLKYHPDRQIQKDTNNVSALSDTNIDKKDFNKITQAYKFIMTYNGDTQKNEYEDFHTQRRYSYTSDIDKMSKTSTKYIFQSLLLYAFSNIFIILAYFLVIFLLLQLT